MDDYSDWIGRRFTREEPITRRLIDHFRVTLAGTLAEAEVPLGLHWCLAPDAVAPDLLGRDCHPRPGLFLPALPLPRRMWAGGELMFHAPFAAARAYLSEHGHGAAKVLMHDEAGNVHTLSATELLPGLPKMGNLAELSK